MDPLVARIRRTLRRHSLAPPGARLLVAVSGGADSMVLLDALRELQQEGNFAVVGLAHLNHGIRGEAAAADQDFCRLTADRLGLPFDCELADVLALSAERRCSVEAAGHAARYEFLERAAGRLAADRVAVGHTRDDQAETFLLRLMRGAGPRGLAAMYPRAGIVIRPMLDCSRRQVREFAAARGIEFREDATNGDLTIPRNLIRHGVLPSLARVSPGIVRILGRAAAIARDDAEFMEQVAGSAFVRIVSETEGEIRVDAAQLRVQPIAVARRVAALAISRLSGGRFVAFEHVERLLDLVHDVHPGPRQLHLPGQTATRIGDRIVLRRGKDEAEHEFRGTNFRFLLSIPGEVTSPDGWTLSSERKAWHIAAENYWGMGDSPRKPRGEVAGPERPRRPAADVQAAVQSAGDGSCAVLDARAVSGPLVVRNWLPGDRVRPLGMTGTRKLQDVFVDRKVPRSERARVPVVADASNRVLWVPGYVTAEDFRVTGATSDVVILKLKYWRNGT